MPTSRNVVPYNQESELERRGYPTVDLAQVEDYNRSIYKVYAFRLPWWSLSKTSSKSKSMHTMYKEKNKLQYYVGSTSAGIDEDNPSGYVLAFTELPPKDRTLKKYGIDGRRDIVIYISRPLIEDECTFMERPNIGDIFKSEGELYEVNNVYPSQFYGNTEYYLTYSVFANTHRKRTVGDGDPDSSSRDFRAE